MDELQRPAPKQPPITITHQVHIQQTDYLTMNLKKMTGEPVPAPRHIFRPVPAPRQIRRPELDKLVLCDVPCQEVEVEGGERPLGQKVGHQVPVPAGSRELEAEEEPSGESTQP